MRPSQRVLIAAGALMALAAPEIARAETDPLRDPGIRRVRESFAIERLSLFDKPAPRAVRGVTCTDSTTAGLTWCASATSYESSDNGTYSRSFGYNLDAAGRVVYIILSRREFPLARSAFDETMKSLGARYGHAPTTLRFEGKTADGDDFVSIVAYWGNIKLVRLSEAEMRVVAQSGTLGRGPLVDHRQNLRASAQRREPVYRIEGTAGFVAEFLSVIDVRTDYVLRAVYQPAFLGEQPAKPEAAAPKFRDYPLDPGLARALAAIKAEEERLAAIERARREAEERKAAEERARRAEAERRIAEERRAEEERLASIERARREEEERKAAEARRVAEEAARKLAAERAAAEERARRAEAERKAAEQKRLAEERARREEAERKAAEAKRIAEQRARLEEAERKAAAERRALEERARRAEAEYQATLERVRRAEAERKAAEERARQAEVERHAAEERTRRIEEERKAAEARREAERRAEEKRAEERRVADERRMAEERARREEAERKSADERHAAEERASRAEAERKASEERRAADERRSAEEKRVLEERVSRAEAERKAVEDRRAAEERRVADERRAAEERRSAEERRIAEEKLAALERASRAEAERRAAAERRSAEERQAAEERRIAEERRRTEAPRSAETPTPAPPRAEAEPPRRAPDERRVAEEPARPPAEPKIASVAPGVGGPAPSQQEWQRMAVAQSRNSPVNWIFERARDPISEDIVMRTRAIFSGGGAPVALEIAFECNIGAGKRLNAHVRAFDEDTKASVAIPSEDGRTSAVRGTVALDDDAPQTAFLFPEQGERQASIVEIPLQHDDVRKNTPRAEAWLRHYRITLKFRAAKGEATATIYPYAENLRRVLEGCSN